MEGDSNPLHIQWYDSRFPVDMLAGPHVMEYFGQPESNPFFDRNCVNQRIQQQLGHVDEEALRYVSPHHLIPCLVLTK